MIKGDTPKAPQGFLSLPHFMFCVSFKWWVMGLQIKALKKDNKWSRQQPKTQVAAQVPSDNKYFHRIKWMWERIRPRKAEEHPCGLHMSPPRMFLLHVCDIGILSTPQPPCLQAVHPTAGGLSKPDESERGSSVHLYHLSAGSGSPLTHSHFTSLFWFVFYSCATSCMSAVKMAFENAGGLRYCNLASDSGQAAKLGNLCNIIDH